ncbi:tetratricopeptide repeat protein, partial [Desulfovibrio piger]|uniref:tetratricopeptide repeat protein n=1 Tax=Desulfovibrio piger TaxID=901 RepID=UPI0026E9615D
MDAKSWIQEIRAAGKLMAAGDLAGAENRYRQLLDKGTDNPLHKALALDGLGRAVFEQGRQAEAIEAIEAAVSLLRERQGVQDPATCGALQNLGRLYLAAGQVEKSIAVSREAVDGLCAGFGEDHPLVAGAMMRLSACLYMQRDLDGAEALLLKARDVFEKQSGDESRMDVSTCLNNLGRIHEERGDLEQGIALHRQAVAIRKELLGDHTETAFSLGNLGVALATAGQWQEAVDTLQEALDCYARAGHTTGPDIEGYRKNLEI